LDADCPIMLRFWKSPGARLFLGVLFVYSICPPFTSFDSYWTVPTALSILCRGSTAVDEYAAQAPKESYYAVECVPAQGRAVPYDGNCAGGHLYNFYPIGVPVITVPMTAVLKVVTAGTARKFPGHKAGVHPIIDAFLSGDLVGGRALVELWTASLIGALAAWLQSRILGRFLPRREAVLLALLFAFGTSQWSLASRSLMQHGPSVLCLSITLYLLVRGESDPRMIPLASIPLAMAFVVRPSNFIPVAVLTAFVAIHHRDHLVKYLLWSLVIAIPFFVDNVLERHSLFPTYYHYASAGRMAPGTGMLMNLFSPSRGLLVYTPIAGFSIMGMVLAFRRNWCFPLTPYLAAIVVLHTLFISFYWPGHCYGPRYFADMSPILILFYVPAVIYWRKMTRPASALLAVLFMLCATWSVFVHARGATSVGAQEWSLLPINVDQAHWRVWDWRDPQFWRGL
jgi:hypothetical protein